MYSPSPFNAYSRYYDLLYRDKDYQAEVDYVHRLLQTNGVAGRDILEFGSGTGIHGRLLAQRDYRVKGIERSIEMVGLAKQIDGFSCVQGDICSVRLDRTFDAVLSLFHVISYQISNDSVCTVFTRAADHLETGGLFIFDVWFSPAVHSQTPEIRVKRMEDEAIRVTRIAEPTSIPCENRVDVHYTVTVQDIATDSFYTFEEIHPMRHFSLPEIDLFAQAAGFERLSAEEWLTGAVPSEASWGVCLVLRKK